MPLIFITFGMLPFYEKLISELKQFQVAFLKFLGQFGFMIVSVVLFLSYDDIIFFMFYLKNHEFNLEFKHINKKLFYKCSKYNTSSSSRCFTYCLPVWQ